MNKGSLPAQCLLTAVDMTCPQFLEPLSRQLWLRVWSKDEDISKPDSFRQAGKLAGMRDEQLEECIGIIKDSVVKNRLKENTEEALEKHNAFGSPTIVAHVDRPVMLFGSDRFLVLAQILGEKWEGPQPGQLGSHL